MSEVEQEKFDQFYGDAELEPEEDWESDDPCDNCGPWYDEWGGDGLCMVVIRNQSRQRADYNRRHTGERNCPVCKKKLRRYDVLGVDELWTWAPDYYDPIIAIEVLGPLWLNKGEVHHKGNLFHVWIEWGTGREERLIRLIPNDQLIQEFPKDGL